MEQMLEVRHISDDCKSIIGWLPTPYRGERHVRFALSNALPNTHFYQSEKFDYGATIEQIDLEIDVCHDTTENPRHPYIWKFYKSNVSIDKLRKIRNFVENRPSDPYEEEQRDFLKMRYRQMMKITHPPMILNPAMDKVEELFMTPGHVVFIKNTSEVERVREEARRTVKRKKETLLLLVGGN